MFSAVDYLKEIFLGARKDFVKANNGNSPIEGHKAINMHQKLGFSKLFTMAPGAFIFAYIAGDIAVNGVSVALLLKYAVAGLVLFGMSLIPRYIA